MVKTKFLLQKSYTAKNWSLQTILRTKIRFLHKNKNLIPLIRLTTYLGKGK